MNEKAAVDSTPPAPSAPWVFGNAPLSQTRALARVVRRLVATALSLEEEDARLARLIKDLSTAEQDLARRAPLDPSPRVGSDARPDQRVYLDHGPDIGAFNPCFPEYEIHVAGDHAAGTVSFPLAFEGPPGLVHGGFLAVFFDCAIQHHNCEVGVAGKTTSLDMEYRRPTPLLTTLHFEIERSSDTRRITSTGRIEHDGTELCRARMEAVAGDRARLPSVSPRRNRS
jgi:acyl-coenzyme A thioesterase PaaI-like protein